MGLLKRFNPFYVPSTAELKMQYLERAERDLMEAEYALEHFQHEVSKLKERVARLKASTAV